MVLVRKLLRTEVRIMISPGIAVDKTSQAGSPPTSWRRFVRHYLEMVAAMLIGMAVLAPVWVAVFTVLRCSSLLEHAEVHALVMATDMTIGMALWMRVRAHSWARIGEMAAAMFLPFIALFGPYWAGWLSAGSMLLAGHVLMLAGMLAVMLGRREEYARDHRRHRALSQQHH
jgi:hypothetical protein